MPCVVIFRNFKDKIGISLGRLAMKKMFALTVLLLCISQMNAFAYRKTSFSIPRGGFPKYKMTKPYVTKQGQFRCGAIKDVSSNGNKFDNANVLGMNPERK